MENETIKNTINSEDKAVYENNSEINSSKNTDDDMSFSDRQMLDSLSGLIRIPSVKGIPEPGAPFGFETLRALEYMLSLGNEMGFTTKNIDGFAGYIEFGEGSKELAILCHLDVVPADKGWSTNPFEPVIHDGKITGRGTNDDKGPAVAALYAMKVLKEEGFAPPCRVRLILGLDEESGCECMAYYKTKEKTPDIGFTPDAKFPVIYAEKGILHITVSGAFPQVNLSDSEIKTQSSSFSAANPLPHLSLIGISGGERANMVPAECTYSFLDSVFDTSSNTIKSVTVHGKPGHASMPENGENAISKAVNELYDIFKANNTSHPFLDFYKNHINMETDGKGLGISGSDSLSGALTCNVGLISFSQNLLEMTFDIRYPVTFDRAALIRTISEKISAYGMSIKSHGGLEPICTDPESDFIQTLLKVFNETTHLSLTPVAIGGGTYARSMPGVVAFGPNLNSADDVAHQAGEYMRIDDLFLCSKIYKNAIKQLASKLSDM
jgi:succinyl-diaminopimelate desuccinylase